MLRPQRQKIKVDYDTEVTGNSTKQRGLRLSHKANWVGLKPGKMSPFPWSQVVATQRRESALEGLLFGCAIADALSLTRNGLHPRVGLKLFGRNPIHYQFQPGIGVTSHRTHSLLITIQAILLSKADTSLFVKQLKKRIAWYQRAFPLRHAIKHFTAIYRYIRRFAIDDSLNTGFADDPLVRSLAISVILQGNMNSALTWFQQCVEVSHTDSRALHASVLVGNAAQVAQVLGLDKFNSLEVLRSLIDSTDEPQLNSMLVRLKDFLSENRSISYVAKHFGWKDGIPAHLFAITIMGIYAWLRYPKSYRRCVERSVLLGGSCSGVAVVAGSLSGILLGKKRIPSPWLKRLTLFPYKRRWGEELIERVKDWPHGVEDIQRATALPSLYFGQIVRNLVYTVFRTIHGMIRLPMRVAQFSVQKRSRKSESIR